MGGFHYKPLNGGSGSSGFSTTVQDELFEGDTSYWDPVIFHHSHFQDDEYRVILQKAVTGETELWRTPDFATWTLIDDDLFPLHPVGNNGYTFQGGFVRSDGTFVLYETEDEGGAGAGTAVWTGAGLESMTRLGQVITEVDCGVYYDEASETVHIYSEDADTPYGTVSSEKLSHWTTPANDLLNATQLADAIDSGGAWGAGDPHIIKIGSTYYLFTDYTTNHPDYRIRVYSSSDLTSWTLYQDYLLPDSKGGDIDLVLSKDGTYYHALLEFGGADERGIAHWTVTPP